MTFTTVIRYNEMSAGVDGGGGAPRGGGGGQIIVIVEQVFHSTTPFAIF